LRPFDQLPVSGRPQTSQRTTTQWKVGMIPLPRTRDNDAPFEHGLRTVERRPIHDRLEVALC
jgi:hypothetical protein